MQHRKDFSRSGFNLVELLVVLATFSFLAMLVLPALARKDSSQQAFQCINNHKRLMTGWVLYAEGNRGSLVPNPGSPALTTPAWVYGDMRTLSDSTNTSLITAGLLFPYVKSLDPYKCPANGRPITRHISMNSHMAGGSDGTYQTYAKLSQIPKPSELFVTMDESEMTINDGCFRIQGQAVTFSAKLNDWPGSAHEGGSVIAFADGRAEVHLWKYLGDPPQGYDPTTMQVTLSGTRLNDAKYLIKISTLPASGSW